MFPDAPFYVYLPPSAHGDPTCIAQSTRDAFGKKQGFLWGSPGRAGKGSSGAHRSEGPCAPVRRRAHPGKRRQKPCCPGGWDPALCPVHGAGAGTWLSQTTGLALGRCPQSWLGQGGRARPPRGPPAIGGRSAGASEAWFWGPRCPGWSAGPQVGWLAEGGGVGSDLHGCAQLGTWSLRAPHGLRPPRKNGDLGTEEKLRGSASQCSEHVQRGHKALLAADCGAGVGGWTLGGGGGRTKPASKQPRGWEPLGSSPQAAAQRGSRPGSRPQAGHLPRSPRGGC